MQWCWRTSDAQRGSFFWTAWDWGFTALYTWNVTNHIFHRAPAAWLYRRIRKT